MQIKRDFEFTRTSHEERDSVLRESITAVVGHENETISNIRNLIRRMPKLVAENINIPLCCAAYLILRSNSWRISRDMLSNSLGKIKDIISKADFGIQRCIDEANDDLLMRDLARYCFLINKYRM